MDREQMAARCPGSEVVGRARLDGHRYVVNARGVATVVAQPGAVVHGLLWDLLPGHEDELDHYEGVAQGLYRRTHLEVTSVDGDAIDALVYIAADSNHGTPRPGYQEMVAAAARAAGCPDSYCDELGGWLG